MKEKKKRFKHEHGSSFSVDYYAYASHMRSWNAGFKVLFSIISLLICIACNNLFVSLAVIFFMGFLTVAVGGLDLHHYIALEARCYDGDLRFLEEEKPLKAGQIAMAVIFIVVLMLIWFFTR